MPMGSPIAWCPGCRSKLKSTRETAGANERPCTPARFSLDGAYAAVPTDVYTVARTHRCAHGHVHIDLEWAIVPLRSCPHTRGGGRRIRRGGMDYHCANRCPNARHDPGGLDGRDFRAATRLDRCLHRI